MENPQENASPQARREMPLEQSPTGSPVISNPQLPAMEKVGEVKTVQRNIHLPLMGTGAPQNSQGAGLMTAVTSEPPVTLPDAGNPQQPKQSPAAAPSEGYIRLRMRLDDDTLSVVAMKRVEGPLTIPSAVVHGYVYEVLLDNQQIAMGSVPDVGVRRSFANRDVPGPEGKHHFARLPAVEFMVRIPINHVSTADLAKLHVVLNRVSDAPDRLTSLAPLAQQPGVQSEEVRRLAGINLEAMPPSIRTQFEGLVNEIERGR